MRQRAGKRLLDLRGDRRVLVIGQPVVLPAAKRELALQEQFVARNEPSGNRRLHRLAHGGFVVVLSLIGRIDAAKTGLQGQLDEPRRPVLFPRRAVQKLRHCAPSPGQSGMGSSSPHT